MPYSNRIVIDSHVSITIVGYGFWWNPSIMCPRFISIPIVMLEQIEYRHFKTIITKNGFVFENSTFYRLQDDYKYVYIPRFCFTAVLQLHGAVQDWHHVILESKGESVGLPVGGKTIIFWNCTHTNTCMIMYVYMCII